MGLFGGQSIHVTSSCSRWMSAAASEADRVRSSRLFTMLPSRSSDRSGVTCSYQHHLLGVVQHQRRLALDAVEVHSAVPIATSDTVLLAEAAVNGVSFSRSDQSSLFQSQILMHCRCSDHVRGSALLGHNLAAQHQGHRTTPHCRVTQNGSCARLVQYRCSCHVRWCSSWS